MTTIDRPGRASESRPVVLLNPPGSHRYLRDCYCSNIDKAGYYWQPFDLVVQSGWLSRSFSVELLDAVVRPVDSSQVLADLQHRQPCAVLALTGSLSWWEDRSFLEQVKKKTGAALFVSGDLPRFQSDVLLRSAPFLDGALLDLATPHLAMFLESGVWPSHASLTHRVGGEIITGVLPATPAFSYPLPRFELFWAQPYRFPLYLPEPMVSTATLHGCPFQCAFCNTGMIHFALRDWDNLNAELDWCAAQGVRSLQIRDGTFNHSRPLIERFCEHLLRRNFRFTWFCFARPDTLDEELIALMARAGCRYLGLGLESADPALLARYKDRFTFSAVLKTLEICRRHGIETLGHFILGLPGETEESLLATRRLVRRLPLDYASFNLFTPRPGARLLGATVTAENVQHRPAVASFAAEVSLARLLRRQRQLYRAFYLRPGYLRRRLLKIRSWSAFRQHARQGRRLLAAVLFPGDRVTRRRGTS